jgi:hypothetical protein
LHEKTVNLFDDCFNIWVFSLVVVKLLLDAHSVERMSTRENIKLAIKDWLETQVAHLTRINSNMFVLLLPLLLSEHFGRLTVVFEFLLERLNFLVVVIKAFTEMALHILNFLVRRK